MPCTHIRALYLPRRSFNALFRRCFYFPCSRTRFKRFISCSSVNFGGAKMGHRKSLRCASQKLVMSVRRERRRSSVGATPTWQLLLQPVAIGAVVEVTIRPKPSMERVAWRPREPAGPNISERHVGLETVNAGADPADIWGRPPSLLSGEQPDPCNDPAGVGARAGRYTESERNT